MNLLFTVVLAAVGFNEWGYEGALTGCLIGGLLDSIASPAMLKRIGLSSNTASPALDKKGLDLFCTIFARFSAVDGHLCEAEKASFQKILAKSFKLPKHFIRRSSIILAESLQNKASYQLLCAEYYEVFKTQPSVLMNTLTFLFEHGAADKPLTVQEVDTLRLTANVFALPEVVFIDNLSKIAPQQFARIYKQGNSTSSSQQTPPANNTSDIARAREILGCSPTATREEVTRNYRRLIGEYHPDKIAGKNLPKGFTDFAHNKVREIIWAQKVLSDSTPK